jgi:hypothetical protein
LNIRLLFVIAGIFFLSSESFGIDSTKVSLPFNNNIFEPTTASINEAKNGFLKDLNRNVLLLQIGTSSDLISFYNGNNIYSIGVDFFTYSNLRAEQNFKFPVDAIDYFFGINLNFCHKSKNENLLTGRLRLSHISTHLVDGHKYDNSALLNSPFVYSREFFDVALMYQISISKNIFFKNLFAVNLLFHSIPDDFGFISLQYGAEFGHYFNPVLSIYISNDFKLFRQTAKNCMNYNLITGLKFGKINSKSISVYFSYYNGMDFRGQYYMNFLNYKSIGVNFDL